MTEESAARKQKRAVPEDTARKQGNARKQKGNQGEAETARYLEQRGCTILARQWRCRYGEIDLIARDSAGVTCFVEVKTRGPGSIAPPRASVDWRKQRRIRAAASLWLRWHNPDAPARFDVAEVYEQPDGLFRIAYWENAFM